MFNSAKFALFFSREMGTLEWGNLTLSGVRQIMFPWNPGISDDATLRECHRRGLGVTLRIPPEDLEVTSVGAAQERLLHVQGLCEVRAVIVGNEPDGPLGPEAMEWGRPWGESSELLHAHLQQLDAYRKALQGHGAQVLSPGWTQRDFTENSPPQPGIIAWAQAVRAVYDQCDGNCVHVYGYGWPSLPVENGGSYGSAIDVFRFMYGLRFWSAVMHRELWIDEANIDRGPNHPIPAVARMAACIEMARVLAKYPYIGGRVAFFAPFVSSGYANAYPPGLVMEDPEGYRLLGKYMRDG
jgi:hypothetical protein